MRATLISTNPLLTDSNWWIWARILCFYQSSDTADPDNDLNWTDTQEEIEIKVNKALNDT